MFRAPTITASEDELRDKLRGAGLRVTSARLAVLRVLMERDVPSSHPELSAVDGLQRWDRATLYRNLMDLTEAGILRRLELGDHVWRFELTDVRTAGAHAHPAEHPHFLCTVCGDLACLPEVIVPIPAGAVPAAVRAGQVTIQFRGRCDRCAVPTPA